MSARNRGLTQGEAGALLESLRPVVQMMLIDVEKTVVALGRGDITGDEAQTKIHGMAAILGVDISQGRAMS